MGVFVPPLLSESGHGDIIRRIPEEAQALDDANRPRSVRRQNRIGQKSSKEICRDPECLFLARSDRVDLERLIDVDIVLTADFQKRIDAQLFLPVLPRTGDEDEIPLALVDEGFGKVCDGFLIFKGDEVRFQIIDLSIEDDEGLVP